METSTTSADATRAMETKRLCCTWSARRQLAADVVVIMGAVFRARLTIAALAARQPRERREDVDIGISKGKK
jgi:hypothetical protein